jgi:hypothetical protein
VGKVALDLAFIANAAGVEMVFGLEVQTLCGGGGEEDAGSAGVDLKAAPLAVEVDVETVGLGAGSIAVDG